MNNTLISLTDVEFASVYPLIPNPFNPSAVWTNDRGQGCLFETFGDEYKFVRQQDPATVWTLVDGDDGEPLICSGLHYVNRVGYLVSTQSVPPNSWIVVHLENLPSWMKHCDSAT